MLQNSSQGTPPKTTAAKLPKQLHGREALLYRWLVKHSKISEPRLALLAGDASFRRYLRVLPSEECMQQEAYTEILVDAPSPESPEPFHSVALAYQEEGLRVPQVYAVNEELGTFLIEDLGHDLLLGGQLETESLYQQAIGLLPKIMRVQNTRLGALPPYSKALLEQENQLFLEWLLGKHLNIHLTSVELKVWQDFNDRLIQNALEQPRWGVHRDYHSRNLMILPNQELAVIDFQDAVIGPMTYDLVSLLRDCYVKWPDEWVKEHCTYAYNLFIQEQLLATSVSFEQFMLWFDWMGLQRHTKASGIFARLFYRDQKATYLNDIPQTIEYLIEVSAQYPELADYHKLLTHKVQPVLEQKQGET